MDSVPFHVPTIDEADIPGVLEVLRARWVTTGPKCREFESKFAAFLAEDSAEELHALAVNSCTAALHLALEAVGVGPGDRVIVPVWTFTATAEVVRYLGADPVFVDVDPRDFNLRADTIRATVAALPADVRDRIKAVLPVHYGGLACDMHALETLCCEHEWSLLDDAAHALPTRRDGKPVGRWGRITSFSFYATKTLCTGEGGMVVTREADLAARMKVMRLHGISRDAFDRYRSKEPAWFYEVIEPGYKYNLGDLAAALGLSQLARVHKFRDARAAIAAQYTQAFAGGEGLTVPVDAPAGDLHAWHLYPLRVSGGRAVRDALIEELAAAHIGTSVHFIPLHRHPYWRERYALRDEDFPVATELFSQEVSLPIYPAMSRTQIERVIEEVPRALRRARDRTAAQTG
jgi:dTDP-4-amino-4,6-dideoxygalactose transaminase